MKKIDYSPIAAGIAMPYKKGTWKHLQEAYQEAIQALASVVINDLTKITILYGCIDSGGGGGTYNISAGAVYYNGEIYLVDATGAITPGGGQTLVGVLAVTFYTSTPDADPVKFTDGNTRNIHQIRKIKLQAGASGSGITSNSDSNFANFLDTAGNTWRSYDLTQAGIIVPYTGGSPSGTWTDSGSTFIYKKVGKIMLFEIQIQGSLSSSSNTTIIVSLAGLATRQALSDLSFALLNATSINRTLTYQSSFIKIATLSGGALSSGSQSYQWSGSWAIN